ncbi:MAG: hypothetical protein LBU27_02855 [Candidatus Peribacteria bacterium]|jgi:hypothetical protein|nr:hypothetical protein [Candidatus Peribacteria bacterium]
MKITETIKSISDAFIILEQLESEEWRNSNGIGEIEIEFFKEECLKKIKEHQSEAHIFIEGTLKNMNTSRRHSEGISTEIKRLSELQSRYEREYERGKNRIDYLMKTF